MLPWAGAQPVTQASANPNNPNNYVFINVLTLICPDGPCALPGAFTRSLSPGNLFSHIPWPIFGPGSCGLARWAEIVFLCSRLAKITLITLTAVTRTP